ncbi:protein argonaute 1-like [Diplodia corticola]|uniref:Protein argonaute 1-like n=1 Tax=Diplodia corticola TaxID=236234 RepID=A0A1J9S2M7_9PEZI|nr:protein argonaute 1-like [Diplodia corticola]OJD34260.1 protein argonaute 1-like [Diplodia corticola]
MAPKKAPPPSSDQKASVPVNTPNLHPCPRCRTKPDHDLKQCKKQIDLLNRTEKEIEELEPKRKVSKKYPAKGWVGLSPAESFFREADFRSWVLSEEGRVARKQTKRQEGNDEHKGMLFHLDLKDLEKRLFPSDKCLRCNAAGHIWPMCTTRVSLDHAQQPYAWPAESTDARFRMERDFKSFVEGAIDPKEHSQFLVSNGESCFLHHFEPVLTLPPGSKPPSQSNYNPDVTDNRAALGHQMVSSADMSAVPSRPGFAESQGGKTVLTNHFIVDLPDDLKLFKYILAGQRDATSPRGRKKEEMERFITESPTLNYCRDDFATDEISLIISTKNLYPESPNPVPSAIMETRTFKKRGDADGRQVNLIFGDCIDINTLKNHVQLPRAFGDNFQPAIQALNILLLKGAAEDAAVDFATFRIGNNRVFRKSGYDPIGPKEHGSLLVCHRGYFSTITPGLGNVLLNLNVATSAFFMPLPLKEFLHHSRRYFGFHNDSDWVSKVDKLLRGVRVWITYDYAHDSQNRKGSTRKHVDPSLRIKTIRGLGLPLSKQTFEKDGKDMTVFKYLSDEYPTKVTHHHAADYSVNLGTQTSPRWYAPSTLHILPYQPFRPKLSADLQSSMINVACKSPDVSKAEIIDEGLRCMALPPPSQGFLARVGVTIHPNLMMVPCREINTPTIINKDANGQRNPVTMKYSTWNMVKRKHLDTPASASIAPVLYIHASFSGINKFHEDFMTLLGGYLRINTSGGFTDFSLPQGHFKRADFHKALTDKRAANAKLVVFIALKDQGYEEFKQVADQIRGIQSLCIRKDKFFKKYMNDNPNPWSNYVGNVSMKLNLKFGGINHEVYGLGQVCTAVKGELPVMVLGADVTHPSPGSVGGLPSIAAVVGSTDKTFGRYGGSLRLQYPEENKKARETIKSDLMESMVKERLEAYKDKNGGRYPEKILYYRDGVGEGQYTQVKEVEISAIRHAFKLCSEKQVAITAVVTTKRHHTRLYPGNGATCKRVNQGNLPMNVTPGTTVESEIVSPDKFDFFLVSHVGIKGTSRPTYYTVIENGMKFDAKGIQDFTNALCYTYVRATMSVSYAPPAYYADRLCERGRVYLRQFFDPSYPGNPNTLKHNITQAWGGTENANPWHSNLNNTMFWM